MLSMIIRSGSLATELQSSSSSAQGVLRQLMPRWTRGLQPPGAPPQRV
jgi:hypothetical protein